MEINSITSQIMKFIVTNFKKSVVGSFRLLFFTLYMNVAFLNFIRSASGRQPSSDKISYDLISYDLPEMTLAALFCNFCKFSIR